ncbi:MAG: ASKHA domain-containing protein [Dehalococcoidia bacterium]|nr:ASKHA domain-containing protein [Dehalococcoidia bacterium]
MADTRKVGPVRVTLENLDLQIEAPAGVSLFTAIRKAGLPLNSECGGRGTCGQCKVRFLEGATPATAEDQALIASWDVENGWRLACQAYPTTDCRILIPQTSIYPRYRKMRVLAEAVGERPPPRTRRRGGAEGYGVAIDVGTTTVVCYLMDLREAQQIGVATFTNPQQAFGPDIIARITHAHRGRRELRELQRRLVVAIDRAVDRLCREKGIALESMRAITVAGNMTMLHLLRGIDPWPMGVAPYKPVFRESPPLAGADLGFRRFAHAHIDVLPGVDGHLGSDVVAGVVALGLPQRPEVTLFMDLGTNGEVVVCCDKTVAGTSCAAGPAFEGVHIRCGMPAFPGAIDRVSEKDGRLELRTIENETPQGVCGSGLVDAVALLLRRGLLLPSGRLQARSELGPRAPPDLRLRLGEEDDERQFLLYKDSDRGDVVLTQSDIREVQLAKAPIRAGIEILLKETNLTADDVENAFVAGAFGSSIRPESLLALGVLPESLRGRIHAAGNTAGLGARLALTYPRYAREVLKLARNMRYVELVLRDDFRELFAQHLAFPSPESMGG